MNLDKLLEEITIGVSNLNTKKNINEIAKLRNENDTKIKQASVILKDITNKFINVNNIEENDIEIMTSEEYELEDVTNEDIDKIDNIKNLDDKIKAYKNIMAKIKSRIAFINSKKMVVVDCDQEKIEYENVIDIENNQRTPLKKITMKKIIKKKVQ